MSSNFDESYGGADPGGFARLSSQEYIQMQIDAQGRANVARHKFLKQFQSFTQLLDQFSEARSMAQVFVSDDSIPQPDWVRLERVPEVFPGFYAVQAPQFQALADTLLLGERKTKRRKHQIDVLGPAEVGQGPPATETAESQSVAAEGLQNVCTFPGAEETTKITTETTEKATASPESHQNSGLYGMVCAYVGQNETAFDELRQAYNLDQEICRNSFKTLESYLLEPENENCAGYSYATESEDSDDYIDESEPQKSLGEEEKIQQLLQAALQRVTTGVKNSSWLSNWAAVARQMQDSEPSASQSNINAKRLAKNNTQASVSDGHGPFPTLTFFGNRQEHTDALKRHFRLNLKLNSADHSLSMIEELVHQTSCAALNLFYAFYILGGVRNSKVSSHEGLEDVKSSSGAVSCISAPPDMFQIRSLAGQRYVAVHSDDLSTDGPDISQRTPYVRISPHYRASLREFLEVIGFCLYLLTSTPTGRVLHIYRHHFCIQDTRPEQFLEQAAVEIPDDALYVLYSGRELARRILELQRVAKLI